MYRTQQCPPVSLPRDGPLFGLICAASGLVWSGQVWSGLVWSGLVCVGSDVVLVAVFLFAVSMALQLLMIAVWQFLLARLVEAPSARCVHVSGVDGVAAIDVFCLAAIASTLWWSCS